MKKLLYVVAKAEYFLSHRLDLANAAKNSGFDVAVASTNFSKPLDNFQTFKVDFKRGSINPLRELIVLWKLLKVVCFYKPHLIHNVALKPALYAGILARIFKIPSINSINGFGYIFTSSQLKAKLLKPLISFCVRIVLNHSNATIIVQNQDDFSDCAKILPKANLKLVPGSGVNTNHFYPEFEKLLVPLTFVLAARMLWSKGVQEYVDAAIQVKKYYPDTRFLLVGEPDLENPESIPTKIIEQWNSEGFVEWLGYQSDMKSIYDIAHVSVLPSYREGMPKALLEAMACGLPIITTNVRGCKDLFCDNGYLVPAKDSAALANAMENFIKNPQPYEDMASKSLQAVQNFYDSVIINKQIIAVYSGLNSGDSRRFLSDLAAIFSR